MPGSALLRRTHRLSGSQPFVGREDELRQLAWQLKPGGTVVVTTAAAWG